MKHVIMVGLTLACCAALLVGCSKKTPAEGDQGSSSPASSSSSSSAPEVMVLGDTNFDSQIATGVVLVDFWATWCGPCKIQGPIVEGLVEKFQGTARIAKLDVDKAPRTAQRFNIASIPTLIVFKDGKPVKQFIGVTEAETLASAIQAALDAK